MKKLILLLTFCGFLASCGGGGGGNDDKGGDEDFSNSSGVRIVHGALDGSPVNVLLDTKRLNAKPLPFGSISPFYKINEGRHEVRIEEAGNGVSRVLFFDFRKDDRYTILFSSENLTTTSILEPGSKVKASSSEMEGCSLQFVHAVNKADDLDIVLNGNNVGSLAPQGLSNLYHIAPGPNQVALLNYQGAIVWKGEVACKKEEDKTLLVTGEEGYFVTATSTP
jgi:hypothetical protein